MRNDGDDGRFWEIIDLMRGIEPRKCKFANLGYDDAIYEDLEFLQCMYYVHWRDNLENKDKLIRTDDGYARLWMADVADRGMDPQTFDRCIEQLKANRNNLTIELEEFSDYWHRSRGDPSTDKCDGFGLAAALLRSPEVFPRPIFNDLFGFSRMEDRRKYGKDLGRAIRGIDIHLRAVSGTGLMERITRTMTETIEPFDAIPYRNGGMPVTVRGRCVTRMDIVKDMLTTILDTIVLIRDGEKPEDLHGLEGVIARSIDDASLDSLGPITLDDGISPIMHDCMGDLDATLRSVNSGNVRFFRNVKIADGFRSSYVPSTDMDGELTLSPESKSYYTLWKRCMDRGEYLDTDDGYVMLLIAEMLVTNDPPDVARVMDRIVSIHDAYGTIGEGTAWMVRDISIVRGFPFPVTSAENIDVAPWFIVGVASSNMYAPTAQFLRENFARTWEHIVFTDDRCAEVFRRSLVTAVTISGPGDIGNRTGIRTWNIQTETPLYNSNRYYTGWKLNEEIGTGFVRELLDNIVRRMNGWGPIGGRWFDDIVTSSMKKAELSGWRGFDGHPTKERLDKDTISTIMKHPEEHAFEPCGMLSPKREDLSEEQLRYYAYWCRNLEKGVCLPSEIGYITLWTQELMGSGTYRKDVVEQIEYIIRGEPIIGRMLNDLIPLMCIRNGLTIDRLVRSPELLPISLQDMLSHPASEFDMEEFRTVIGLAVGESPILNEDGRQCFNTVIAKLDSYLAERGMEIPDVISEGYVRKHITIRTTDGGREDFDLPIRDISNSDLMEFITCIEKCCRKILGNRNQKLILRKSFNKDMADAAMDVSVKVKMGRKPSRPRAFEKGVMFNAPLEPSWFPDGTDYNGNEPMRYVPSSNVFMQSTIGEKQQYYAYWRSMVGKGVHPDTDDGYVMLYLDEIIAPKDDRVRIHRTLKELRDAYDPYDRNGVVWDHLVYHCLLESIPLEDCGHGNVLHSTDLVLWQIAVGKPGYLTREGIAQIAHLSEADTYRMRDETVDIINNLLRESASMLGNGLTKFRSEFRIRTVRRTMTCPWNSSMGTTYMVLGRGSILEKEIPILVNELERSPSSKGEILSGFGPLDRRDILRVIDATREEAKRKAVILNMDAVKDAESALADVTDMMRIEDAESDPVKNEEPPSRTRQMTFDTAVPDSPWESLRSILTDKEREYLSDLLDGRPVKGKDALRLGGSINTKAMDTVGDTILENGIIIDDYTEDIRSILQ